MKSEAKSVDEYLLNVPAERLDALNRIRELCVQNLPGYEESMVYKMPSYKRKNDVEVAFASQKQNICIYILKHEVMLNNKDRLKGINHGKGCIRFPNPSKIDYDLLTDLFKESFKSSAKIC
ncbi:MAG: DUF1801 domain-containing protein [Melioribacteraceae bacterium]|nr:DUF1801 domain-containing protein [Melioribacteraceae bacterium]MCF8266156.1 DUF1801 domain-containing protein [Melioribacteraceae bacterium]MCF8430659.1 DUF1801 domain-containing protein [Melioribacteraceae bacterium]